MQLVDIFNSAPNGNMTAFWESGDAPVIDPQGNIIMATGNGAFDAYPAGQGAPAGNTAVGWPGYGIGFAGIPNSVAVPLGVNVPSDSHNYTGLFYNGDFVTDKPVAPNVFRSLDGSPVDFQQAAKDQAGEHTMKVNLSYDGSTLTETITDETTGGVAKEIYTGVNIPATVGGSTAWVGLSAAADGVQATHDLQSWTYSTNGSTVVSHPNGFASHSDLTLNGDAAYYQPENAIRINKAVFDSTGTTFFMNQVNITNFNTTFEFKEMPKTNSTGDGIAFVVQNAQQMRTSNDYGDSLLKLAPTPGYMTVLDSFTPSDQKHQALLDLDFGTSGTTIIPTSPGSGVPAASVTLAKNGQIYVVDPNRMGGLSNPAQTFFINSPPNSRTIGAGQWGSPLYFNNRLYLHAEDDLLKSYQIVPGPNGVPVLNPTPIAQQGPSVYFPGTNPTASANGTQNGIIWDLNLSNFDHSGPAVLNAYDANTLTPLYTSSTTPFDQAGPAIKFTSPVVAGGQVFVPAARELDVYGLIGNTTYGPSPRGASILHPFRRR